MAVVWTLVTPENTMTKAKTVPGTMSKAEMINDVLSCHGLGMVLPNLVLLPRLSKLLC